MSGSSPVGSGWATRTPGFDRFQHDVAEVAQVMILPLLDEATARQAADPVPFDVAVPWRAASTPALTAQQRFEADVFAGFVEIAETIERLRDVEVYLRRFPFAGTRVTRERYLRQHVELYLHEVYVLRERLVAYAKRTTRAYRRTPTGADAARVGAALEVLATTTLSEATKVRGRHVHETRFDETRLRNLGVLELVARHRADDPMWQGVLRAEYRKVRAYWVRWAEEMTAAVGELLERYFALLYPIVFAAPSRVRSLDGSVQDP